MAVVIAALVTGCGVFADESATVSASPTGSGAPTVGSATPLPPTRTSSAPDRPTSPVPTVGRGSPTIVPALQEAAVRAVGPNSAASLIALDMRNGEIVSTVHRQAGMSGAVAPGSTFKIVTASMFLTKGVVSPDGSAPCPANTNVNGQNFHNVSGMSIPNATFRQAFAHSCNTSLINLRDKIGDRELADFSTKYFGLNSDAWKVATGQGSVDGVVPAATGENDKAAQFIGQGALKMNPLTMASVVATAVTGKFRQPVLERGMNVHTVKDRLPREVSAAVKSMMIDCATTGSAKDVFRGMPGVGAKTGTAEVGDATNGWMVAFRGDIAVAVYVEGGTSGSGAAGPIVRDYLTAVPAG
jgi:cell division protein FtsI/penicillin-binding protein 2